jgi:hypothetical protein
MEQEILKIQRNCKIKDQELKDFKQSRSYRIGRMITFIPRKLRDVFGYVNNPVVDPLTALWSDL